MYVDYFIFFMQAHRDLLGLAARARRETEGNLEQMAHLVQPD